MHASPDRNAGTRVRRNESKRQVYFRGDRPPIELRIFRGFMLKSYQEKLAGLALPFPVDIEKELDAYLSGELPGKN